MATDQKMSAHLRKHGPARDTILQGKVDCERCDDTNTICLACDQSIMECDCGPDAEPCSCDACYASATLRMRSSSAIA
jgi:hypothetical protein